MAMFYRKSDFIVPFFFFFPVLAPQNEKLTLQEGNMTSQELSSGHGTSTPKLK